MKKNNFEQLLQLIADMEHFSKANDFITKEIEKIESQSISDDFLEDLHAAQSEPLNVPMPETQKKDRR